MTELLIAFSAGLISFLSPCVLPLIPGYISYISGTTYNELVETKIKVYPLAFFTLGFSIVFILFGAAATFIGKLFESSKKYESGTGWPSFSNALPGVFKTKIDYSFGMKRIEYHCANCGAHHGHVFNDGPGKNGKRFCNNGLCLIFKPIN